MDFKVEVKTKCGTFITGIPVKTKTPFITEDIKTRFLDSEVFYKPVRKAGLSKSDIVSKSVLNFKSLDNG